MKVGINLSHWKMLKSTMNIVLHCRVLLWGHSCGTEYFLAQEFFLIHLQLLYVEVTKSLHGEGKRQKAEGEEQTVQSAIRNPQSAMD